MTNNFLARDNPFVLRQFDMNTHIRTDILYYYALMCQSVVCLSFGVSESSGEKGRRAG